MTEYTADELKAVAAAIRAAADRIDQLEQSNLKLREAIVDALAAMTPGYEPYQLLADALDAVPVPDLTSRG